MSLGSTFIFLLDSSSLALSMRRAPNMIFEMSLSVKLYVNFKGVGMNFSRTRFHRSTVAWHIFSMLSVTSLFETLVNLWSIMLL